MAIPAVTVERGPVREVIIAQGALAPRAPKIFALAMSSSLLMVAVLFAIAPLVIAIGASALMLVLDAVVFVIISKSAAATVRVRVAPGTIEVTTAPFPTKTVRLESSRLRGVTVAARGLQVKVAGARTERIAVHAQLDDGKTQKLFATYGRAAAVDMARHLTEAVAELGGPSVGVA
jgi:hypothetical protein